MWMVWLFSFFLFASPALAEPGFDEKYERDYNIFNPANRYATDNPLNPANRYDLGTPVNSADQYNHGDRSTEIVQSCQLPINDK